MQQVILPILPGKPHLEASPVNPLLWSSSLWESVLIQTHEHHHQKSNLLPRPTEKNVRSCPEECRRTALYLVLVRLVLEYSAVVWDPYQQRDINKLEDIQRHTAPFVKQDYRSRQPGSITKMLKDLNLPSVQDRWREKCLSFSTKLLKVSSQPFQQNPF